MKGEWEGEGGREKSVIFKVINIQGLTKVKAKEVEELIVDNSLVVCLTETQKKLQDVNFEDNLIILDNMREEQDRKGGGLMLIFRRNKGIELQKIDTKNRDILHVKGKIEGWDVRVILVYFSVNDENRNMKMRKEIEEIMEGNSDPLIIAGDFNGHTGFKGEQKVDKNGEVILNWLGKYGLIMLNDDVKCRGEFTWARNNQRSVIDYFLVSDKVYDNFKKMNIDEEKDIFDLSDHHLMEVEFMVKEARRDFKNKWVIVNITKQTKNH